MGELVVRRLAVDVIAHNEAYDTTRDWLVADMRFDLLRSSQYRLLPELLQLASAIEFRGVPLADPVVRRDRGH